MSKRFFIPLSDTERQIAKLRLSLEKDQAKYQRLMDIRNDPVYITLDPVFKDILLRETLELVSQTQQSIREKETEIDLLQNRLPRVSARAALLGKNRKKR